MYNKYLTWLRYKTQVLSQSTVRMPLNFSGTQISWSYDELGLAYIVFRGSPFLFVYCGSFSLFEFFKL